MAEGETPKADGDILYGSEANWALGFGDGTDGAFSESSGTTNLTQGTPYQYTSFLLDTSATISASSTSQYPIIIYVQGNCVINGTIDLTGKGATSSYQTETALTASTYDTDSPNWGTKGMSGSTGSGGGSIGGKKGLLFMNYRNNQKSFIMNGLKGGNGASSGNPRSGGGGGSSSDNNGVDGGAGSSGTSATTKGDGGNGGCSIIIIIGGTLTFGASSSIDVSGANGTAASGGDGGGGGGGGSGDIIIIHRGTKTDNGLSTDVTAGSGGAGVGEGGTGGAGGAGNEKIADWATILW